MIGLLIMLAAQAAVEPPRTVNGIEVGRPENFATHGPARVCMRDMVLSPREGETAYLSYSGIHNGGLRLVLANDEDIEFTLGEIFIDQRRADQGPTFRTPEMRVYLIERGSEVFYQIHGRVEVDDGEWRWRPLVNVEGSALGGNRRDDDIFRRLSLDGDKGAHCDRRYNFGWGVILGDETIDSTEPE
jgi:hypothetical protein